MGDTVESGGAGGTSVFSSMGEGDDGTGIRTFKWHKSMLDSNRGIQVFWHFLTAYGKPCAVVV